MAIERVCVLGCGTIGASWAAYFRARGLDVAAWDPAPDARARLERTFDGALPGFERLGLLVANPGSLELHDRPESAVEGAGLVQESAPERLETKHALYRQVAPALAADAILASSTSFLMPSALQEGMPFAERLVVGHPFNPPHLIPLVEVVGGKQTAPDTVDRAVAFYDGIGKRAVRLEREAMGHLVNRLQVALWREAVHAVESGLASVADVDAAIAYGPGLRWALMGPHLTFHLAGGDGGMAHFIDHLGPANEAMWNNLGSPSLTADVARKLIEGCAAEADGKSVPELRAERDAQLLALLEHTRRVS